MTFDTARDEAHEAEDQQPLLCPECGSFHTYLYHSRYFDLTSTWVRCLECGSGWVLTRHGGMWEEVYHGSTPHPVP